MHKTIYSDQIKVNCPLICDESGYYHLIYKITNIKNGKIYIGKHTTKNPYDDYFGSGIAINKAIEKYGIENFTKEIIFCFTNEKEAYLKEESIVTQEFVNRKDTYNIITGGHGFSSEDLRGEKNPMFGKSPTQETRNKISKANKGENNWMFGKRGKNHPFYEKRHTQETKDKISKANRGKTRSQEAKNKISNSLKGRTPSQEAREKMSKAHKGEKSSTAKAVLKLDEFGNIITEYVCKKDCREQENLSREILDKLINKHILHNGFYFEYKIKNNRFI